MTENREIINGVTVTTEEHGFITLVRLVCGDIIGAIYDRKTPYERRFMTGDVVKVTGDTRGYICPGITKPGLGRIAGIEYKNDEVRYHVVIGNEDGLCKSARIELAH